MFFAFDARTAAGLTRFFDYGTLAAAALTGRCDGKKARVAANLPRTITIGTHLSGTSAFAAAALTNGTFFVPRIA